MNNQINVGIINELQCIKRNQNLIIKVIYNYLSTINNIMIQRKVDLPDSPGTNGLRGECNYQ